MKQSNGVERFEVLVAKARRTCAQMTKEEQANGHESPQDCPIDVEADTALCAMRAALACSDWDHAAESYVMLENVVRRLRQNASRGGYQ